MLRRLALLGCVAIGLAPGTWLRSDVPPPQFDSGVTITRIADVPATTGPFRTLHVWQLRSTNDRFGSYSALRAVAPGRFLTVSDRGNFMRFRVAGNRIGIDAMGRYNADARHADKFVSDIEALAHDPASGRVWAAYEGLNSIERRDAALENPVAVRPKAMTQWRSNRGPEAMVRFADGSFVVIGEGTRAWTDSRLPAVRFASDPVEGGAAIPFAFTAPDDFRPTDMAALPDGRVLILLRRVVFGFPPRFEVALMLADPSSIAEGESWTGTMLATFSRPFPTDNYEGLAVEPSATGYPVTITMIADDNNVAYQRTLVAQLAWDGSTP